MAHFAKVNNGIVTNVIVAEQEFIETYDDGNPGVWLQTSYNTIGGIHYDPKTGKPSQQQEKALRKNFAGIGYSYDDVRDAFIPIKPYESWLLNETTCLWEAPIPRPEDGNFYIWDESQLNWVISEIQG